MNPTNLSIIPHYFSIRDHHTLIINFQANLFLDARVILFYPINMHRLTSLQPKTVENYLS